MVNSMRTTGTPKPFPTITPQNTTFVIDLHEVLMHPNYWSMFRRIFFRRTGWKLLYAFWRFVPRVCDTC